MASCYPTQVPPGRNRSSAGPERSGVRLGVTGRLVLFPAAGCQLLPGGVPVRLPVWSFSLSNLAAGWGSREGERSGRCLAARVPQIRALVFRQPVGVELNSC
jgi:hypothetical protein